LVKRTRAHLNSERYARKSSVAYFMHLPSHDILQHAGSYAPPVHH
jgi:hypothetical protein